MGIGCQPFRVLSCSFGCLTCGLTGLARLGLLFHSECRQCYLVGCLGRVPSAKPSEYGDEKHKNDILEYPVVRSLMMLDICKKTSHVFLPLMLRAMTLSRTAMARRPTRAAPALCPNWPSAGLA